MHKLNRGVISVYQRRSRRCGAWMVAVSLCLRLCMHLGLDAGAMSYLSSAAGSRDFVRWMLFLETGTAFPETIQENKEPLWILEVENVSENVSAEAPFDAAVQDADVQEKTKNALTELQPISARQITIAGKCSYQIDKEALLKRPSDLDFSGTGPRILILHTHGTEAYSPESGQEYNDLGGSRTLDSRYSVIAVGAALAKTLEEKGIAVLHDTRINDYPSYNNSYWTALDRIQKWKEQYPELQMIIDLHRDAVEDELGRARPLSLINEGESFARLMLVVGTDQGGLEHPHWQENLANGLKLQSLLEGMYPGLCRNIDLRTERFNQHAAPGSVLIEVGTNGNTLSQAVRSAELLGEGIAGMIWALEENIDLWGEKA